jgi:hypothetical protein
MNKLNFKYGIWFHKFVQEFVTLKGVLPEQHICRSIKKSPDKTRGSNEINSFLVSPFADFIQILKPRSFIEITLRSTKRPDIILSIPERKKFILIEIKTSMSSLVNIQNQFYDIIAQTKKYSRAIRSITGFKAIETIYLSRYGVWILNARKGKMNHIKIIQKSDHLFQ